MSEARDSQTFRAIFLFTAVLYLFFMGMASYAFEKVDQSNLPPWAGGWTNINPISEGVPGMWQTFTPEQPSITAVEVDILTTNPGQGDDTLTVEISKEGQILASAERYVEDGFDGLLRFGFAEAVAVVSGELYELKLRDTGKTHFGWKYASNTYDAGSRYVFASERPGTDWFFQTYAAVEPRIIYVDDDATGANDGSSWENAYVYLQDALADANSAEKPVEILVAQGIYKPNMGANQMAGDREATFQLINSATLKGGYVGFGETDPNARDVDLYETFLSGDLNSDDVEVADPCNLPNEPTRSENSCHVTTGSGTDMTAVLDGFTITAGNADGSDQLYEGGGMYNSSGSPTLIDCTFNGNSALRGGGVSNWENSNPTLTNCKFIRNWANYGAAIQNNFTSSPILTNCSFTENSAELAGGMYNGSSSNPKLVDCTFSRNRAERGGGGMDNSWLSSPMLTNCIFSENSAWYGGGMVNWDFADPTLTNCTFSRNSGRGLYNKNSSPVLKNCIFSKNSGGMFNEDSDLTLTNCAFSENSVPGSGGGINNLDSSLTLNNCTFTANSAWYGGGISSDSEGFGETKLTLTDCTFTGNLAVGKFGRGGGMYCSTQSVGKVELKMKNCTFIGNLAVGEHGRGGGIYSSIDNPILTNCTFSENSADGSGGAIYNDEGWPEVSNCRFSGNSAGGEGGGLYNIGGDFSLASPTLTNCTFSGNVSSYGGAIYNQYGTSSNLVNCILWCNIADYGSQVCLAGTTNSLAVEYSNLQGGSAAIPFADEAIVWGPGNIDIDPDFVRGGYWTEPSPRNPNSSVWIEGDYHLKSEAGRWDPVSEGWIADNVTSPCIDAGDPNSPVGDEPDPNGGRINMGAYGGTAEANKSPAFSWFFETTQGPVLAKGLGIVLPHEHIFTDLRGPTTPGYGQADAADVVRIMAPLLVDAREKGVGVFIECSSIGVGRNVQIIAQVAEASGLPVVVSTGVYGRANFAPPEHRNMTEDELAALFISEIQDGIGDTGIKAGFIKIATDEGPMNTLIEKILRAAGRAASQTSAAIASHTPTGSNAVRQVDILESIDPAIRFIWVHAQNESNRNIHLQLATRGAYIEFDSLGWNPGQDSTYISAIKNLLAAGHGDRILLSHDAGWYQPGSANGGTQKPFTYLIDTFIPKLRDAGIDGATIRMITQINPVRAFGFKSDK